jgi:hypothetical protein
MQLKNPTKFKVAWEQSSMRSCRALVRKLDPRAKDAPQYCSTWTVKRPMNGSKSDLRTIATRRNGKRRQFVKEAGISSVWIASMANQATGRCEFPGRCPRDGASAGGGTKPISVNPLLLKTKKPLPRVPNANGFLAVK